MPQKLINPKQQVITISKPLKGWASQKNIPGQGAAFPVQGEDGQYSLSSFINLHRGNFEGDIAPGECFDLKLSDAAPKVNQLPVAATTLGTNYAVLANNRVVQFTSSAIGQVNFWDTVGHGGHSASTPNNNNDIISNIDLSVSPNLGYVFYSWEDATDGDIGIITQAVSGGSFSQTAAWYSTLSGGAALKAGVPRKMCIGTDGNLYTLNGQYIALAQIVGNSFATAAATPQKLNLGNGYVAASLTPYQNFLVVIGNKSADVYGTSQYPRVRVWFWDYASANPTFVFDLDDFNGLRVFVDASGNLWAITSGKDSMTSLLLYNGSTFAPPPNTTCSFPTASISAPLHNQVDSYNGFLHFVGLNSVNQFDGNGFHNAMGFFVLPNGTTVTAIGFFKNIDTAYIGAKLFDGINTTYGIFTLIDSSNHVTYAPGAVFYDQLRELGYHGRVVSLRLFFSQFGTGASFKASMYQGFDTATDLLNRTITFSGGNNYNVVTIPMNVVLDSFWFKGTFNHSTATAVAAILRKAEVVVEQADFKL